MSPTGQTMQSQVRESEKRQLSQSRRSMELDYCTVVVVSRNVQPTCEKMVEDLSVRVGRAGA